MGESGSSLFRRLIRKQVAEGLPSDLEGGGRHFDSIGRVPSRDEMGYDARKLGSDECVSDNSTLLSLQPWVFRKGVFQVDGQQRMMGEGDRHGYDVGNAVDDSSEPPSSPWNYSIAYGSGRNYRSSIRSSARSRRARRYSVKPINSVEDSLIPQLYGDSFVTEEFVFGPVASSSLTSSRPFCITDGSRIISKSGCDLLDTSPPNVLNTEVNVANSRETVAWDGLPPQLRKFKRKSEEMQLGGLGASDSRRRCNNFTLQETHDRLLLFCMGISIGVISSMLVNKKEVEQLNNLLKHRENLVQDLQEELDMKDSFTVNELVNDPNENQQFDRFSDKQEQVGSIHNETPTLQSTKHGIAIIHQSNSREDGENLEYLSQIEAELEAELERLELNMCSSSLVGTTSAHDELEPDLITNVVHGELRADTLKKSNEVTDEFHVDSGGISSTQNYPADYSVSPRELSLRLHELNQSRLEERIEELEAKLRRSQKQLQLMEAEKMMDSLNSSSDIGSSSNHASPTIMEKGEDLSQPLCLNLSGDALDAYEEAYEEFVRVNGIEQLPSSKTNSCEQVNSGDSFFSDVTPLWDLQDDSSQHFSCCNDRKPTWKHALYHGSNKIGQNDCLEDDKDDNIEKSDDDDDDDEEGRLLIQQIVRRMRQDSSQVLNARRMLFPMDK